MTWVVASSALVLIVLFLLGVWGWASLGSQRLRDRRARRPLTCRIDEEWGGYFIGRRNCLTHNVVWDDGGSCPREGQEPGQGFKFARDMEGDRW